MNSQLNLKTDGKNYVGKFTGNVEHLQEAIYSYMINDQAFQLLILTAAEKYARNNISKGVIPLDINRPNKTIKD